MQQRTVRRGLATSAVAALTITGLSVTAPSYAAGEPVVRMVSQRTGVVSTKPDGTGPGSTITLVAERLDPLATVRLEVNPDPRAGDASAGWVTLSTNNPSSERFVSASWDGTANGTNLAGTRVALRAAADLNGATTYSTLGGITVADATSPVEGTTISATPGYFAQPYAGSGRTQKLVGVSGTTSATEGNVEISAWRSSDGTFRGQTAAAVRPTDLKVGFDLGNNPPSTVSETQTDGGVYQGVLPIAAFDAQDGDQVAVRARRDSDDVLGLTLQPLTINGIGYDEATTTSTGTKVDIGVYSSDGPVAGAEVRRSANGQLVGYTDGAGVVPVVQPNSTSASYYVNTTDVDAYEPGTDFEFEYVAGAYTAAASKLKPMLADGKVFDDREYAPGDIAVQVVDQSGAPYAGARNVTYQLFRTGDMPPVAVAATTDAQGRFVVPFAAAAEDGHHTLIVGADGLGAKREITFVAGDAHLGLAPAKGTAPSGGSIAFTGQLTVSGWSMKGRAVAASYSRGAELVPGRTADAGILAGGSRKLAANVVTRADGTFTVTVADTTEKGRPTETAGRLGISVASVAETASATAAFGSGRGTVKLRLSGTGKGAAADHLRITGTSSVAGERYRLFAKSGKRWKAVSSGSLNSRGGAGLKVRDRNGTRATGYYVQLLPSARAASSRSSIKKLR